MTTLAPALPGLLSDPVKARPTDAPVHHVRAALDTRLRALIRHEASARVGTDVEGVHQMRVSVRRMRAALGSARPMLDRDWSDGLRAELGWLGRALGPVRDLDVLLPRLRGLAADLPADEQAAVERILRTLDQEYVQVREDMLAALSSTRYSALLDRLADAVRLPLPTPSATEDQPELVELVRGQYRSLRRGVKKAGDDPPDEVLHTLRIRGKKLRYVAELAEPALGKPVRRLLDATEELQEVLGDHQDACVAQDRIRDLVAAAGPAADPTMAFVAGRMLEREHVRANYQRTLWRSAWEKVAHRAERL